MIGQKRQGKKSTLAIEEVIADNKYVTDIKALAQRLNDLVASIPTEAILMWIDAHADDEDIIETVNSFTFHYTKKYHQWQARNQEACGKIEKRQAT